MDAQTFEIRDSDTFIPALGIRLNPAREEDRYLIARAGYGRRAADQGTYILLLRLADCEAHKDPSEWSYGRTMRVAHDYIGQNWNELPTGAVVDVQFILGERPAPKASEALPTEPCPHCDAVDWKRAADIAIVCGVCGWNILYEHVEMPAVSAEQ